MAKLDLYNEQHLDRQIKLQQRNHWDLEQSINWSRGIDMNRPLVGLDQMAFFYPDAGEEERLVISQLMGLIIAGSIFEMEEVLLRLREPAFVDFYRKYPVGPEFEELGHLFFEEELKHSTVFRRYTETFANNLGIELSELVSILPVLEQTKTEYILKKHIATGGHSFWWIVAIVEQHFILIHKILHPHKKRLDPLYMQIHQLHFEEEARHAPFPYLMLDMLKDGQKGMKAKLFNKVDLAFAQVLQSFWLISSLNRAKAVVQLKGKHPFFDCLVRLQAKHGDQSFIHTLWQLLTQTPYVSQLINPQGHPEVLKFAKERGTTSIPFPQLETEDLVGY